jgi:hypothetical protein
MDALFDVSKAAEQAGVSPAQLAVLEESIRRQYGSDEMMRELRLLRTLRAIQDGAVSADDAIAEFATDAPPTREAS